LKDEIQGKIDELKKIKDKDNIEDIKSKTNDLSQIIQKAGAELYKKAQEEKPKEENKDAKNAKDAEEGEYKEKS